MVKKITWYLIIFISASLLLVLSSGFYKAMKVTYNAKVALDEKNSYEIKNRSAPEINPGNKSNSIRITILGDSIAKGTGDEKGQGFSGYIPQYFKNQTSKDIIVENAGIDGLRSAGLLEQLQSGILKSVIADSDYILISIGGNDARSLLSSGELTKNDNFSTVLNRYLFNLKESVNLIRKLNNRCIIIVMGIYNPDQETDDSDTGLIKEWNFKTESIVDEDTKSVFLDIYGVFKLNTSRYVAPDRLHPNSAGYQAISLMISKTVESILIK